MTRLLDTNVCIAAIRGRGQVQQRLLTHAPSDCGVSSVSLYELFSGVERCRDPAAERQKVEAFIQPLHLLPFDHDAALHAARIRWHLDQKGQIIGSYDLMLAGQALSLGVILITYNTGEFQRVPGLHLEDWQI
ncbi:MAG: PilT protein domain protein [Chthoniobacteraceae bacterium]|nr:PilT protein domain protein [Chthoniobacteraceae bacterium]